MAMLSSEMLEESAADGASAGSERTRAGRVFRSRSAGAVAGSEAAEPSPASTVIIVLNSLRAEGTPRLALDLCRRWRREGIVPRVVTLSSTDPDLASEFQAVGVAIHALDLPDRGRARYLRMAAGMYRLARRYRPAAVLSMPFGWHAFIAWGAKAARVPKVAAHVGTFPWHWHSAQFRKFRLEVQLGRPVTDRLICCSRYVAQGVLDYLPVSATSIAVIYNGIDTGRFITARLQGRALVRPPLFIVGMIGRIDHTKDYPTLIKAAQILKARSVALEMWLIGEGDRRREYEELVMASGLPAQVRFLGLRQDVAPLLAEMDAFAFSVHREEGLGIALIEAMAAGVPVIASDVGACREVLDEGALGLLVRPGDPVALADAIERVRKEPEAATARAAQARRKALEVFSAERMAAAYAEALGLHHLSPAAA